MKKIINKPENIVTEMLDGLAYVHNDLVHRVEGFDIIARNEQVAGQVGLISGGGSGHEPAHAGFVGDGMLSAAIAGAVFTSPTPDQILEAIKEADQGAGVFMVVKNYSGDIMNFEMAQELAEMEGIEVASVVVDDDIAVENSLYTQGRRGVAGTIFVHKILGHAAREGKSLAEIKDLADKIVPNIHTIGLALSGATVPEVGKPGFVLAEDEIEYGIGIHGEPGYRKESMQPSRQLAEELTGKLLESFDAKSGDRYALLINGMGATPLMEQYVFANDVASLLRDAGLEVIYRKLGNYMTSIDMAGLSLTLMKIEDDAWLEALESPVKTIAW
ncbi:MAG: dihydroxyacetone kinase subunit DhaK [Streptococcus vestibularis]|jgi:dihydroxyacetone kinase-like protein|uniref:Dihydroxyacetone kinase subunit DhaK n=2 Tax=Streptococcus vestibularis TaxID=1343 RepID=A0A3S5E1E2_STRVE|nr:MULTISPECIES: dihydroxyacetone kinase subunit DhaK [Streptococcus]EFX96432.1 dihydroxyacetone kinase, DhaK subunit [Streptococcus vestibularis ATCC 49124]MBS6097914.1 dihydroxyacetone kinase subunit DhaK [Streptococcus vestibularis]MCY7042319.1 dihydroxyacetone kinase subunit DhaK [Streptococcus vestibularis]MDN5268674.1 dihydroxyacetone kinase subunit DhaK [Streptococcus vestibularis]MDU5563437.1 dihydroxyacetone kinase subunit DhaK [Streptococcus vestibularis]